MNDGLGGPDLRAGMPVSTSGPATRSSGWIRMKRAWRRWTEADAEQGAAALAYYLLVSLLPFLVILVAVGSLFFARDVAAEGVVQLVNHFTPLTDEQARAGETAIRAILERRDALNIVAFALMTIGALQFLRTLIRTTNRIWRSPAYSWWRLPLKSLALLGMAAVVVLVGILLPELAHSVQPWLADRLPLPQWSFTVLVDLIPWLVLFGGLMVIYRLAPSRHTTFGEVWFGALIATGSIGFGELLFQVYAAKFGHFNAYYGTLGGIVAFLFWIFVASCACVFGTCVCAACAEDAGGAGA